MISTRWFDSFDELSHAFFIRRMVFVKEQKIPKDLEFEPNDFEALHLVVYDNDMPVACGRLLGFDNKFQIGKVAVLKEHRGKKYGDLVVRMLIRKAFDSGAAKVYVRAQKQALAFYNKLKFAAVGDIFDEQGIEHIMMVRNEDVSGC